MVRDRAAWHAAVHGTEKKPDTTGRLNIHTHSNGKDKVYTCFFLNLVYCYMVDIAADKNYTQVRWIHNIL